MPGPVNINLVAGPVNTNWGPGSVNTNLGPDAGVGAGGQAKSWGRGKTDTLLKHG